MAATQNSANQHHFGARMSSSACCRDPIFPGFPNPTGMCHSCFAPCPVTPLKLSGCESRAQPVWGVPSSAETQTFKLRGFLPSVKSLILPPVPFQEKMPFISITALLVLPKISSSSWQSPQDWGWGDLNSGMSTFICIFPCVPTSQCFSFAEILTEPCTGQPSVLETQLPTSAPSPQSLMGGKLG